MGVGSGPTRREGVFPQPVADRTTERRLAPSDWPEAIATTDGRQLVIAGPGAGKTEFLVRRIAHLVDECGVPGSSVLVLTFSRRAAAGLGARIREVVQNPAGGSGASTFHSFGYRVLERHASDRLGWTEMPSLLTGPEQVDLVSQLLAEEDPRRWPGSLGNILHTRTLAREVTEFILRARERMLDASQLELLGAEHELWSALPGFIDRYDSVLGRLNRLDYGTLMNRAIEAMAGPEAPGDGLEGYRYLVVDEYQDTTPAQARFVAALTAGRGNLTVAADPYQSIYKFRGADPSNVERFLDEASRIDPGRMRKWVLETSFRLPQEIVEASRRLMAGVIPSTTPYIQPAPHPGRVELRIFDQGSQEAEWIAAEAARLHLEQAIPYGSMAVLVRTKRGLLSELSRALQRRSIPHDRPDKRLVDHPSVRMIFDLAIAARAPVRSLATPPMRRLLLGPLFGLGIGRLRRLQRDLLQLDLTWADVIRQEVDGGETLARLLEEPSWTDRPAMDAFWHVWTRLPQFRPMATDPERSEFRAAWASFAQTLAALAERSPHTKLTDYLRTAESDDFEASPLLSYRNPSEDRMVLTTMHQVKGLEFEVVFIADAVEGVLPDLRRNQSLLQVELLDPARSEGRLPVRRRIDEETHLLHVAMTRARSRVVITATSAGADEQHPRPSRFIEVIAGGRLPIDTSHPARRPPLTIREAEAWLRTILADPAESSQHRLAAAQVLATARHPGLRLPSRYAPLRRPGADTGLGLSGRGLSPTAADAYRACPRRFALERGLGVSLPSGPYLIFGNLIHEVLGRVEEQARGQGRTSTVTDALHCLDDLFDSCDLGTGSIEHAWRQRARLLLERLYDAWPHPDSPPVLLEHGVQTELGGTVWRGRIDRIEQKMDGTLRVVDYKTGKTPPPIKEAAGSIQLGFYALAADYDQAVRRHGKVTEAEFWYPLAHSPKRRVVSFDTDRLDEVRQRLLEVATSVEGEDWTPKPGEACRRCEVKLVCPAWPEGQEAFRR